MPRGRGNGRGSEGWIAVSLSPTKTLGTMKKYREERSMVGKEKRTRREKVISSWNRMSYSRIIPAEKWKRTIPGRESLPSRAATFIPLGIHRFDPADFVCNFGNTGQTRDCLRDSPTKFALHRDGSLITSRCTLIPAEVRTKMRKGLGYDGLRRWEEWYMSRWRYIGAVL